MGLVDVVRVGDESKCVTCGKTFRFKRQGGRNKVYCSSSCKWKYNHRQSNRMVSEK